MTPSTVLDHFTTVETQPQSRRNVLKKLGLGLSIPAAASVLAACGAADGPAAQAVVAPTSATSHGAEYPATASASAAGDWQAMDRMYEQGVKAFPAVTEGRGNVPLEPPSDGDVKVFELTCSVIEWEVTPGNRMEAWAYNGMVPGPEIRVREGETVRIVVHNELPESTAIHFHGLIVPNAMDGVPFITQAPITPGETFTYEFMARNPGSHM